MAYRQQKTRYPDRMLLRSLSMGATAIIEYKQSPQHAPVVLIEDFPKQIVHFFAPSLQATTTFDPSHIKGKPVTTTTFTVVGGRMQAIRDIFEWMRNCCYGDGISEWLGYSWWDLPFNKYYHLRHACQMIGCTELENEFQFRMQRLANKRLNSDDINITYNEAGRGSEMADYLVDHVASFFLDQSQVYVDLGPYVALCKRNKAFNEDMDAVVGPRLAFRHKLARERQLARTLPGPNYRGTYYQEASMFHAVHYPEQSTHYGAFSHQVMALQAPHQQQQIPHKKRKKIQQKHVSSATMNLNKKRTHKTSEYFGAQPRTPTKQSILINKSKTPSPRLSSNAVNPSTPELSGGKQTSTTSPTQISFGKITSLNKVRKASSANGGREYYAMDLAEAGVSKKAYLAKGACFGMPGSYQRSVHNENISSKRGAQYDGNRGHDCIDNTDTDVVTSAGPGISARNVSEETNGTVVVHNVDNGGVTEEAVMTKDTENGLGECKVEERKTDVHDKEKNADNEAEVEKDGEKENANATATSAAKDVETLNATANTAKETKQEDAKISASIVVGLNPTEQSLVQGSLSHIKNKAAKRREKKRLANAAAATVPA